MKEKLIIRDFGPIRSMELELSRFTVLIGEQATGKSTVAKLLAVCRYFSFIIKGAHSLDFPFMEGLRQWGLRESIKESSYIFYENIDYLFEAKAVRKVDKLISEGGSVEAEINTDLLVTELRPKSESFSRLMAEFKKLSLIPDTGSGREKSLVNEFSVRYIPISFYQNDVSHVMSSPFFLPTERGLQSIFSLGKTSLQNISDSLFNQLAYIDQIVRDFKSETKIEPLQISYKNVNGQGQVSKGGEKDFFSLHDAASGYQSTIPIVLAVSRYSQLGKKKTFIIEEPEMNLFPAAQKSLIEFLAEQVNGYGHSMLVTTHSPYVLTSLNNLIEAYKVGQDHMEETAKIVAEKYWLDPENVSVFMLRTDGTCENIFDRQEQLIKAEKIDDVSRVLNEQFDNLLQLQFGKA